MTIPWRICLRARLSSTIASARSVRRFFRATARWGHARSVDRGVRSLLGRGTGERCGDRLHTGPTRDRHCGGPDGPYAECTHGDPRHAGSSSPGAIPWIPRVNRGDYIDYIVADHFVIPPDARHAYTEKVAYLPDTFQANDDTRYIGDVPLRAACGLPDSAMVFCCFNATYKIGPAVFDVWMRILSRAPSSVLWLSATVQACRRICVAKRWPISLERLVFTERVPYAEHMARQRLADLFLDTWPFNAGSTATDALWAGLPVLTYSARAFAGRMAGSLLKALDLPELIAGSVREYEETAFTLGTEPGVLARLRDRLARNRERSPALNSDRFCRHLEAAYREITERHDRGDPPADFDVPRLAGE